MQDGSRNNSGTNGICHTYELGATPVPQADELMREMSQHRRLGHCPDTLFILTHPPTVAVGLRDKRAEHPADLLVPRQRLTDEGIALTRSVRGGGITYHWPGQLVCYPVLALGPGERNVTGYMESLEQIGIETLARFGIKATRMRTTAAHVGLWLGNRKIASMGVRISRWITSFGFALNLEGDTGPARYIRPCGLENVELVTMEQILGAPPPRDQVVQNVKDRFQEVFERTLELKSDSLLTGLLCDHEPTYPKVTSQG